MSFIDSLKSKLKRSDDEEEFRRALIDGRYPEGVADFEPLSTTGNFIAPQELMDTYAPDDPLLEQGKGAMRAPAGPVATSGAPAPAAPMPGAPSDSGYAPQPAGGSLGFAPQAPAAGPGPAPQPAAGGLSFASQPTDELDLSRFPADGAGLSPAGAVRPLPARPASARPAASQPAPDDGARQFPWQREEAQQARPAARAAGRPDDLDEPIDVEGDVQVFERVQGQRRPPTPREAPKPFRERLQERVAAANVSGMQDAGLGRSRYATGEIRPQQGAPRADVDGEDLERELDRRRRANQSARTERDRRQDRRSYDQSRDVSDPRARLRREEASQGQAPAAAAPRAASPAPAPSDQLSFAALPTKPEVVRVRSYDDVSSIARAVMTRHHPVVLPMRGAAPDLARRVMDFAFGLCCGCGASMEELGERVYCVLPRGTKLSERELATLRHQGILGN